METCRVGTGIKTYQRARRPITGYRTSSTLTKKTLVKPSVKRGGDEYHHNKKTNRERKNLNTCLVLEERNGGGGRL